MKPLSARDYADQRPQLVPPLFADGFPLDNSVERSPKFERPHFCHSTACKNFEISYNINFKVK